MDHEIGRVAVNRVAVNRAIELCLAGDISPLVAISRMLLGGMDAAAIGAAVADARSPAPAWQALATLLDERGDALAALAAEIRTTGGDHTAIGGVAEVAAFFDHAVEHSPEAGVALHSLGDPALLALATNEIVTWIVAEGLLPPGASVLDFGCGFGRIAAALAPRCGSVLGVDVSPGMVAQARRRHGATAGLRFITTDGSTVPPGPFDLALLVDCMPYILQAGLAEPTMAAVRSSLRPGGAIAVLNLSYGGDDAADARDAARWAATHGLDLAISRPFDIWDGTAFVFRSVSR
jgi:predicted TPR repeat methyltransferase